MSFYELQ
jgi:hypothetical protein